MCAVRLPVKGWPWPAAGWGRGNSRPARATIPLGRRGAGVVTAARRGAAALPPMAPCGTMGVEYWSLEWDGLAQRAPRALPSYVAVAAVGM